MRKEAPLLLVLTLAILAPSRLAAESRMLYGKPAGWDLEETDGTPVPTLASSQMPAVIEESLETPNQRRRRLGLAIEPSFPARDSGQAEETPNHRRARLEQTAQVAATDSYGQELPDFDQDSQNRIASSR